MNKIVWHVVLLGLVLALAFVLMGVLPVGDIGVGSGTVE